MSLQSLTPDRWRRIDEIFNAVLELPADKRQQFLEEECAGDSDLRRDVQSMLSADSTGPKVIDTIVTDAVEKAAVQHLRADIGLQLGPYTLMEEVGSGGMGSVYRAVRSDEAYKQSVAIKLVHRGMNSDHILNRFRFERQILANLNHPNIARIIDAGSTPDGRPYFVMEFVDGLAVIRHIEENKLSIRERLQLFESICAAVQHAHQKLIIHRDLKPSNILVTKDGVPKLLDFGIAKVLSVESEDTAEYNTINTARFMTPDYASPEQMRAEELTTASDVYSLGALLYQLLTGQKPYKTKAHAGMELQLAVCNVDPIKPSEAVADPKIADELKGDVDTIVLYAMHKEPARRYESAGQFAADIRNYLEGRAVIARRDTLLYRVQKAVTRNKALSFATLAVLLSLVGGIISSTYQARRAERRFQEVRQLANTFLFDFHSAIAKTPGTVEARALVLKTASQYLASLAAEAKGDPALSKEVAASYVKLADTEGHILGSNLGNTEASKQHYTQAEALLTPLLPDADAAKLLARMYRSRGDNSGFSSNLKESEEFYKRALALENQVLNKTPDDVPSLNLFAEIHINYARMQLRQREFDAAGENNRRGVQLLEKSLALKKDDPVALNAMAGAYGSDGISWMRRGQIREAVDALRKSVELRELLHQRNPSDVEICRDLAIAYSNLADALGGQRGLSLGDTEGALVMARKMVALTEEAAKDQADQRAQYDYAMSMLRLASYMPVSKDNHEAVPLLKKAESMLQSVVSADAKNRRALQMVAYTDWQLGVWYSLDTPNAAAQKFQQGADTMEKLIAEDSKDFERFASLYRISRDWIHFAAKRGECTLAAKVHERAERILATAAPRFKNESGAAAFGPQLLALSAEIHASCNARAQAMSELKQSLKDWETVRTHPNYSPAFNKEIESATQLLAKLEKSK